MKMILITDRYKEANVAGNLTKGQTFVGPINSAIPKRKPPKAQVEAPEMVHPVQGRMIKPDMLNERIY